MCNEKPTIKNRRNFSMMAKNQISNNIPIIRITKKTIINAIVITTAKNFNYFHLKFYWVIMPVSSIFGEVVDCPFIKSPIIKTPIIINKMHAIKINILTNCQIIPSQSKPLFSLRAPIIKRTPTFTFINPEIKKINNYIIDIKIF